MVYFRKTSKNKMNKKSKMNKRTKKSKTLKKRGKSVKRRGKNNNKRVKRRRTLKGGMWNPFAPTLPEPRDKFEVHDPDYSAFIDNVRPRELGFVKYTYGGNDYIYNAVPLYKEFEPGEQDHTIRDLYNGQTFTRKNV